MESRDLAALAREAMVARGLEPDFPPAAIAQAQQLRAPARDHVPDQRHLPWCSIDNDDSRDLDQLTVGEPVDDGKVRILVAIADVDALVAMGTPLDDHAQHNASSVYTPARIFPMLPERLSTDLTSLNPDEDRVAIVISFTVDAHGAMGAGGVGRAIVRNRAKLAYDGVAAWLEGEGPMPPELRTADGMDDQVRMQEAIAQRLRTRRHEAGALDFESTEARAVVADGRVAGLRRVSKNRARAMIEDFMIAANSVTARYLKAKGLPSIRRVVRSPKRWDRLQALAREVGDQLPPEPNPRALAEFLSRRRRADPVRFPDVSLSVIKLLGRGEYVLTRSDDDEAGHFGLAVRDYVHSTAPNRRYPDLITQRLLKAAIAGASSPYANDQLDALATHCTKQEDAADKVERQMRKSAAAFVLSSRIGERFDALVTGASAKGIFVRTLEPPVEGKLVRGGEGLDVGQRLHVTLIRTDVERGFIDFERS
jgi:VacB/RNase II family 3'-5' exoribonuclease